MGYIIIDEQKLEDKINLWNSKDYKERVLSDIANAKADYSHMLKALQQAEKSIEEDIQRLEEKKNNIKLLMQYTK